MTVSVGFELLQDGRLVGRQQRDEGIACLDMKVRDRRTHTFADSLDAGLLFVRKTEFFGKPL